MLNYFSADLRGSLSYPVHEDIICIYLHLSEALHVESLAKTTLLISVSFSLMVTRCFTFNMFSLPSVQKNQDTSLVQLERVYCLAV